MKKYIVENFVFVEEAPNEKGELVEQEVVVNVELRGAQRTNIKDSVFIAGLISDGEKSAEERINNAIEFVKTFCTDKYLAERISKDGLACLTLFANESVQEDLANFIERAARMSSSQTPNNN